MTQLTSSLSLLAKLTHAVVEQAISPNTLSTHKIKVDQHQKTNSIFIATMVSDNGASPNGDQKKPSNNDKLSNTDSDKE